MSDARSTSSGPEVLSCSPDALDALARFRRAADYLSAAQIYLQDNCLLEQPLRPDHLKPRLLGHWGTCPGLNAVQAGLDRLIRDHGVPMLLVTGPGHGAPAGLANAWLEGALERVLPHLGQDRSGLWNLVRGFSWPGGQPSHLVPDLPGVIHEGGELGYALSKAFGAAFDNPDLVVACVVGDGEAETGPTAASWHSTKWLDPAGDGAVLPILHLNEYKIANPTVFGTMDDQELLSLFRGYGWAPRLVSVGLDGAGLDEGLWNAFEWSLAEIRAIQADARAGQRRARPAFPLVILRSPKGLGTVAQVDGQAVAGSFRSHQVPLGDAASNPRHLELLEGWLSSYRPAELFEDRGGPRQEVLDILPPRDLRFGNSPHANGGTLRIPLRLPGLEEHAVPVGSPGRSRASALEAAGRYLASVVHDNADARNLRIACPDELLSNRLDAILRETARVYTWPVPDASEAIDVQGRVMEVLSEHLCQGWLEGYLLTGRHGVFPCYEAFVEIISGMVNQYAKFLKVAREDITWRAPISSFNYLLTSEGWRQEHNGYSHQGPGFINLMLNKRASVARLYLPPDANTLLATLERCLTSTDSINVVVASKQPVVQWLSLDEARAHCRAGTSVWGWASSDEGGEPDLVLASAGTIPTVELLAAVDLLRTDLPSLKVRVVNVTDLFSLEHPDDHTHGMSEADFVETFTPDRPVIFNFHGYPSAIHQLVHHRPEPERFHVRGYVEEGTTTTPFDLLASNGVSRFDLAISALQRTRGLASAAGRLIEEYTGRQRRYRAYGREHGFDPPEIDEWTWRR
jgi:xylulose-5-phosphate/fructose-6-phosphate phosphoketolase